MKTCNYKPRPKSNAYGHWEYEKPKFHLGRHRYINYTVTRIWRWADFRRSFLEVKWAWRSSRKPEQLFRPRLRYRATRYDPID